MDTLKSVGGSEDDDVTESDSDRAGRGRLDSDSASDAAEDLNPTSSDDDHDAMGDDDGVGGEQFKDDKVSGDDNDYANDYGDVGGDSGDNGGESNEEDDNESIDLNDNHDMAFNGDDDDSDDERDDDDDEDEDEDETEDGNDEVEEKLSVRQVTIEDLLREAEYHEEEEEIVMKEDQGLRSLFGDDDDKFDDDEAAAGNDRANINVITREESAEVDDTSAVDSKDFSFTNELLASQAGSVDGSVAGHSVVDVEQTPLVLHESERYETKAAMFHIMSKVSLSERRALNRGIKLEGPPVEEPIAHVDEFKRYVARFICV